MKLSKHRLQLIFMVISLLVFVAMVVFGVLFFLNIFAKAGEVLGIPFMLFSFVFFGIGLYLIRRLYVYSNQKKRVGASNLLTFGQVGEFYDLFRFEEVSNIRKTRFAKKTQTIIVFSFTKIAISSNPDHNDAITTFNSLISSYLTDYFAAQGKKSDYAYTVYGFSRGCFLLYLFCQKEKVIPLVESLSAAIYELVEKERTRVMVTPFFGIYETSPAESLQIGFENASLARTRGESEFELYCYYDPSFRATSNMNEIKELEAAIDNKELVVYYQPKFSLKEKRFISAEALVRWNSPKYGLLSPASFIEKAEEAGIIYQIDNYVFESMLKDMKDALARGHRVLPVSVNFSLYEFHSPHFLDFVTGLLEKYKIPPTLVEIEITEGTSQSNQFMSIQIIKRLKDKGIRVLMDDFGVGYAGVDNLRKIPFDGIKIDKSFTDLIVEDEKTRSIVKLLVEVGHMNDIEVIIEGVDSQEEIDILKKMKMDTIQGFYYSKPISFADYEALLKDNPFEAKGGKRQ